MSLREPLDDMRDAIWTVVLDQVGPRRIVRLWEINGWDARNVTCEVQLPGTIDFLDKVGFVFVGLAWGPVGWRVSASDVGLLWSQNATHW